MPRGFFFLLRQQPDSETYMEEERAKKSRHISEEENKMGKPGSYRRENLAEVVKHQTRYWYADRQTDPWDRMESAGSYSHSYRQLIYDKAGIEKQRRNYEIGSFGTTGYP